MNVKKSPRLERAQERLNSAVVRLEAAQAAQGSCSGGDRTEPAQDLQSAQAKNDILKSTDETITRRLDATIGRLKTILES
jgi:hypothetical protein